LLALQRQIGNRAVAAAMRPAVTVQRDAVTVQRDGPSADPAGPAPAGAPAKVQGTPKGATTTITVPVPMTPPPAPAGSTPAPAGSTPAAAEEDKPHFGLDVTLGGSGNLAAVDRFDPNNPATALHRPLARWGLRPAAGDLTSSIGVIAVARDYNFRSLGSGWHLGHEPQFQLQLSDQPNMPSSYFIATGTASVDIFHRQFDTAVGQMDWHALTGQVYANLNVPYHPSEADDIGQVGGGLGTALELHPGNQNRVSITAALTAQVQENRDFSTGTDTGSGALAFSITITGNLLGP
jgi:hypothetical protein